MSRLQNLNNLPISAPDEATAATTVWQTPGPNLYSRLSDSLTCDVLIIGGGVGGAMLAYELSRARVNVVVVDRRQPGSGATEASTALLQYELDTPLLRLIDLHGANAAMAIYRRYVQALAEIRKVVRRLDDTCGLATRPSVFIAGSTMNSSELRAECRVRAAAGIECDWVDGNTLYQRFGIVGDSALVSPGAMEVDPLRLTRSLLRTAVRRGARIYGDTDVGAIETDRTGVSVTTQYGRVIRASYVVFATGAQRPYFVDPSYVSLKTTFALATKPIEAQWVWSERCLMWEANDPYFYARLTPDDRILVGGEDLAPGRSPTQEDLTLASIKLLSRLRYRVPQVRDIAIEHVWAGTLSETRDGLPIIDRAPESSRVSFVTGHGGNGITFGWIASKVLAGMVLAEPDPIAPLFRMSRFDAGAADSQGEFRRGFREESGRSAPEMTDRPTAMPSSTKG